MSTNHSIGENAMKTNNIPATFMYALVSLKQRILRETATASIGLFRPSAIDQAAEQFRNTLSQDTLWNLNGRFERGAALAKQGAVTHHADPNLANKRRLFQVMSANQSRPPYYYMVDLDFDSCECPDHCKGHYCKHIIASHIYELASHNPQSAKPPTLLFQTPDDAPKTNQPTQSYQVQPKAAPTLSETLLRSSEPCVETSVPAQKDSVIWGAIKHEGQWLGVEILALEEDNATIRALPKIIEGKKLQPQFPFEGKRCTITIPKKQLFHVTIFQ
jgi:hypothetical protein